MQLSVVTLVACFLLATCKTPAAHEAWVKKPYGPCKNEEKEWRSDSGNLFKEDVSSTPDSNLNIEPHNGAQHSSRKDIVVKDPGQLKVLPGVKDIRDKRIRKVMASFRRGALDAGRNHKIKMKHPRVKHVKDRGVQSVSHLLRLQALEAVENLRKKIHNGNLPNLLSPKSTVKKLKNKTLSTQENLESSRNKLFRDVRKLIHRIILRKKNQALEVNDEKHHKAKGTAKTVEYRAEQRSTQRPVRKVHNGRAKNFSSHNVDEYHKSERQKALNDEWGALASQPLSTSPPPSTTDDGKWANLLDLHQFFSQMKGLPMGTQNGNSLYGAQIAPGMMSPSIAAADLTSPFAGSEGFNANAPKQLRQLQQQNQMQRMADYFNTQAQAQGGVQPALVSQPAMGNIGLDTQASYPPDLSSIMQMNNPLASFQPFLSRFYRPSMQSRVTNPQYFERTDDLGPGPYRDPGQDEEQNPDWNRVPDFNRARDSEWNPDDDLEEGPIPPDEYPEDRDEEAPDHDDDGYDEEDDDGDPYHRRQKSTIQFPLNQSKKSTQ